MNRLRKLHGAGQQMRLALPQITFSAADLAVVGLPLPPLYPLSALILEPEPRESAHG